MTVLEQILGRELIPVLAPVAQGADGQTYNVNADTFAGAVAGALKAKRLMFLTDVPGVLDKDKNLIKHLKVDRDPRPDRRRHHHRRHDPEGRDLHLRVERGVEGVVILDGKIPHAVLIELLTDHGAGTLITRGDDARSRHRHLQWRLLGRAYTMSRRARRWEARAWPCRTATPRRWRRWSSE